MGGQILHGPEFLLSVQHGADQMNECLFAEFHAAMIRLDMDHPLAPGTQRMVKFHAKIPPTLEFYGKLLKDLDDFAHAVL
jgi:hypothetical protein